MKFPSTARNLILLALATPALGLHYDDYTSWTSGRDYLQEATVSGDLLVCTGVYAQTETVFTYRIEAGGRIVRLGQVYASYNSEIGLVAAQGDFAWAMIEQSFDYRLQGLNLTDPTDIQLLGSTPLTGNGTPLDLFAIPGWLVVVYTSQYATVPIHEGGVLGVPVYHSHPQAARMGSDGELLLMPTPAGGAARRMLSNGLLETVREFPAGLNIARAARAGSEYTFAATDGDGPGLFVYDSTCTAELARLPIDTLPTMFRAQGSVIVTGTSEEGLSMYAYEQGTLSPRGNSRIIDYLHRISWLDAEHLVCLWDQFFDHRLTVADLRQARWLPVEPRTVAYPGSDVRMLAMEPDNLLFGDASGVLSLLEAGSPMPEPQSLLSFDGAAWPIWQQDGLLAVSHGLYGGFSLVDVTDIGNPVVLSHTTTPDTPKEAVRVGDRLFVADDGSAGFLSGVRIFDIADPAGPVYVGTLGMDLAGLGLSLQDSLLLVKGSVSSNSRLELFNVSDPTDPVSLGDFGGPSTYIDDALLVQGHLVYINYEGVHVLSLPDLDEVDEAWGGVAPAGLVADHNGFYVVNGDSWDDGMVLRFTLDADGRLIHQGGFGLLELRDVLPVGGTLWSLYRNIENDYELAALPAHDRRGVPELELSFDRGHLRFTCSGATLPGEYVLHRESNGAWEEIGRYAATVGSPVSVTLPVPADLRVARFRLTLDVPVR